MNASDLIAKAARLREETAACREYWTTTLPLELLPEDHQFQLWLRMYGGLDNVIAGMERIQQWLIQIAQENAEIQAQADAGDLKTKPTLTIKTKIDVIKYASKVMRNIQLGIDPAEDRKDKGAWMGVK